MLGRIQLSVQKIERLFGKLSSCALWPNDMVSVAFLASLRWRIFYLANRSTALASVNMFSPLNFLAWPINGQESGKVETVNVLCPSVCLFICLSVYLPVRRLSVCLFLCLSVYLPVRLCIWLSGYIFVRILSGFFGSTTSPFPLILAVAKLENELVDKICQHFLRLLRQSEQEHEQELPLLLDILQAYLAHCEKNVSPFYFDTFFESMNSQVEKQSVLHLTISKLAHFLYQSIKTE